MAIHRQEPEPRRSNKPGPVKTRTKTADWEQMPEWALLNLRDVLHVTGLSNTALDARIADGSFPQPSKHGKNRVWSLGQVRAWCLAVTGGLA